MGMYPNTFQGEIHEIERSEQFHLDRRYSNQDKTILLASQVAIKALRSLIRSSKMIWNYLGKLNELGKNKVSM